MEIILSKKAKVYNHQNFLVIPSVEVAIVDSEYIRVGSCLYWRKDLIESKDKLVCQASESTIVL